MLVSASLALVSGTDESPPAVGFSGDNDAAPYASLWLIAQKPMTAQPSKMAATLDNSFLEDSRTPYPIPLGRRLPAHGIKVNSLRVARMLHAESAWAIVDH